MIADTDDGIYMATNRSWSIDDKRLNFQFGCQIAWEIKNGKRGRMLRNPTYTGITPQFWGSLDRVGGEVGVGVLGHAELWEGPARAGRSHRPPGAAGPLRQRARRGQGMSEPEAKPEGERANAG